MSPKDKDNAKAMFAKQLDVLGLVEDFMRDVNQPTCANERRVDRDGLLKWAGDHPAITHRIFFSEADAGLYLDDRPLKNDEVNDTTQPFLHGALALEILHVVLVTEA